MQGAPPYIHSLSHSLDSSSTPTKTHEAAWDWSLALGRRRPDGRANEPEPEPLSSEVSSRKPIIRGETKQLPIQSTPGPPSLPLGILCFALRQPLCRGGGRGEESFPPSLPSVPPRPPIDVYQRPGRDQGARRRPRRPSCRRRRRRRVGPPRARGLPPPLSRPPASWLPPSRWAPTGSCSRATHHAPCCPPHQRHIHCCWCCSSFSFAASAAGSFGDGPAAQCQAGLLLRRRRRRQ